MTDPEMDSPDIPAESTEQSGSADSHEQADASPTADALPAPVVDIARQIAAVRRGDPDAPSDRAWRRLVAVLDRARVETPLAETQTESLDLNQEV